MKDLKDYVRSDATKFRDYLFAKGLMGLLWQGYLVQLEPL